MRPKLLSPLDFPGQIKYQKRKRIIKAANIKMVIEDDVVVPMRAMVARYIAVVMLDRKTTR